MKETEDQRIADKFRQVFEDFEDPASEQGWKELRKKYPETSRKPLFFWLGSAAAVLLLFSGLWLLNSRMPREIAGKKNQAGEDSKVPYQVIPQDTSELTSAPPITERFKLNEVHANRGDKLPAHDLNEFEIAKTPENYIDPVSSENISQGYPSENITRPLINPVLTTRSELTQKQFISRDSLINALAKMSLIAPLKDFTATILLPVENSKLSSEKSGTKGLSFSLYAGSYFNYAVGSESDLNFGAGFSSDIRLSRNFKFSTGLNLAKNSLRYDQDIPVNADRSFQSSAPSSAPSGSVNLVTISNYKAELLSLDIPINIKYIISPDKNDFYILAGLSSGTYLRETYGVQYQNFNTASGAYSNQGQGQQIKKQLQDFDLARTLNVSFGFSMRSSKTQKITIEPFLKYPLAGLGTENLKFGSSGINLKLNFNSLKK